MTPERYKASQQVMLSLLPTILLLPLDDMVAAARRAEALGPILDPTSYRANIKLLEEDLELMEAFRALQGLLKRRMPEAAARYAALSLAAAGDAGGGEAVPS